MDCPLIAISGEPEVSGECECKATRPVRKVTFRWTVDATNVSGPIRTAVAWFDGITWWTAQGQVQPAGSSLVEDTLYLAPGDYRWTVRTLEPLGCDPEPPELSMPGLPFSVATCCADQTSLIGKLQVFSVENGQAKFDLTDELAQTDCVTTDSVIVVVPDGACAVDVEWVAPAVADPQRPKRTQPIALPPDGAPVEVKARVNVAGCPKTDLSVEVRTCTSGAKPKQTTPWFCGGEESCPLFEAWAIYPIIGLYLAAAIVACVCIFGFGISTGVGFFTGSSGFWIGIGITFVIAMFFVGVWLGCLIAIVLGHLLWFRCCPPSFCRWLEDVDWALGWSSVVCAVTLVGGWFFLPLNVIAFLIVRPMMIQRGCSFLQPFSLPHLR